MIRKVLSVRLGAMAGFAIWLSLTGYVLVQGLPQLHAAKQPSAVAPSNPFPDDVDLVDADTDPTLRIPISQFTLTTAGPFGHLRGGYGWLDISRKVLRYTAIEPLHVGHYGGATQETTLTFEYARSEVLEPKLVHKSNFYPAPDYRVEAHIDKSTHFFGYYAKDHWALDRKGMELMQKVDAMYTPLILRALLDFDGVVADFKLRHPDESAHHGVAEPRAEPEPRPAPPPPPIMALTTPEGVSDKGSVVVAESPLTIRGVAADKSGPAMVTINGVPAAVRPKDAHAVEFWSDPMPLKPGDNPVQIEATNSANAKASITFVIRYTPKAASVNPKALDKAEIISLLQGAVPPARIVELVQERGIKFNPTAEDLNDIGNAGGTDALLAAIQKAAPHS